MAKIVRGRTVDDSCLFCGTHFTKVGHNYVGTKNRYGNINTEEGGVIIPHLVDCDVLICPDCAKKIRSAGIRF